MTDAVLADVFQALNLVVGLLQLDSCLLNLGPGSETIKDGNRHIQIHRGNAVPRTVIEEIKLVSLSILRIVSAQGDSGYLAESIPANIVFI